MKARRGALARGKLGSTVGATVRGVSVVQEGGTCREPRSRESVVTAIIPVGTAGVPELSCFFSRYCAIAPQISGYVAML
jgi:hypothetical protein